jgi:hypothetical protein
MTGDAERTADFRRCYLNLRVDDQRDWYEARTRECEKANRQAVLWRNLFLLAASIAGVAGAALPEIWRTWLGLTAAVCAALAAALAAYETLMGFGPNAKLYRDAAINLDEAGLDDDVEGPELEAQVRTVEAVFRSENGQWGQLALEGTESLTSATETPDEPCASTSRSGAADAAGGKA